ncbi:MAG: HNH endonuclease signature motif containing protein [Chloroflexota bacterium]|nr:HNH endonuclease signature motif containing protein [Chloroflexota bacterium]
MILKQDLSPIYRRIKKDCCPEWGGNPQEFYTWYERRLNEQKGCCAYCGLPGNTKDHYGKWFRDGRRGQRLEVDRKESKKPYSAKNCVLACYPCNNAKSDVFSHEEFLEIGKVIHRVKNTV